jgi:SAM-dependent methyltransferase
MTAAIGVVVRCGSEAHRLYDTLRSIERQEVQAVSTVVVVGAATPSALRPWVEAMAVRRGILTACASATEGAQWNAGVRVAGGAWISCLDAGDRLDPRFLRLVAETAQGATHPLSLVTTGSWHRGGTNDGRRATGEACDVPSLLAEPDAVHGASVFRRATWDVLGGFDETLPALASFDFFLRVLLRDGPGAVIPLPLLQRLDVEESLYRRARAPGPRASALASIARRHQDVFSREAPAILLARARLSQSLGARHGELVRRRNETTAAIGALGARIQAVRESLPPESGNIGPSDLRRTSPVSLDWGFERGLPIDRRYIEEFMARHAGDIRGRVLEIQEPVYTERFGGSSVQTGDVLDVSPANPGATIVADLRAAPNIPDASYDCLIVTQTLHVIDDVGAAVAECERILKPGGVLLATFPSASRVCLEYGPDGDFWRVTEAAVRRLATEAFPSEQVTVRSRGNVLSSSAFLYGVASQELSDAELDVDDPFFPTVVTLRAMKPAEASG